tara:strand:- start:44 stop:1114 length:1071 start_codon:yes stop_codon:yes gene_type:complete
MRKNFDLLWDSNIKEYEIDPSWKKESIYKDKKYLDYRSKWESCSKGELATDFPLNIEMEPTYYCNLKCPFCPRKINDGERTNQHMKPEIWKKILNEMSENNLPSLQMDHEAESMMNPKFFDMLKDATESGVFDTWLHTNGQMLNEKNSKRLIENGLKKLNISIDAVTKETYEKLRVGGSYEKLLKNVETFLKLKKQYNAKYLRVRVSFVEQEENFHEKKGFFDFWKNKEGINVITFQRCMDLTPFEKPDDDHKLSEKQLDDKYKNTKPFFCYAPWETPTIEENGKITPCLKPVRNHSKDFYIGDIAKGDTIKSSWNSEKMKNLRKLHQNGQWYKNDMCRTCVKITRSAQHQEFNPD